MDFAVKTLLNLRKNAVNKAEEEYRATCLILEQCVSAHEQSVSTLEAYKLFRREEEDRLYKNMFGSSLKKDELQQRLSEISYLAVRENEILEAVHKAEKKKKEAATAVDKAASKVKERRKALEKTETFASILSEEERIAAEYKEETEAEEFRQHGD